MRPKTIFGRPVVTRSISSDEGLRCVDIFRRKDNSFGFEEYRTADIVEKNLKSFGVDNIFTKILNNAMMMIVQMEFS